MWTVGVQKTVMLGGRVEMGAGGGERPWHCLPVSWMWNRVCAPNPSPVMSFPR